MSFPTWNSDPSWNKITSSYFRDNIDLSGNFIIRNGTIRSPANEIQFDDTFGFVNFVNSVNVFSQLKNTYNSVEYDVGLQCEKTDEAVADIATLSPIVSDTAFKLTGLYWDAGLSSTVFTNNVSFPNGSISSLAINNSSFVALSGAQTIDGVKTFNSAPVMSGGSISIGTIPVNRVSGSAVNLNTAQSITSTKSYSVVQNFNSNIRLDGSLLVNNGANTLTNAQLQNIADIGTLKTITTAINYTPATTTTLISNVLQFSGTLNGWNTTNFSNAINYAKDLTSSAQAQINTINTNSVSLSASNIFTGATNQFSNSIRLDGTLVLNANTLTLTNANLQKIQYLSTVSSDIQTQTTTNASNITTANTNISTLTTKTTGISYAGTTTTIANTLAASTLTFSTSLNNITSTVFGYLSGATSSIQNQLNLLSTTLATTTTSANEAKQRTTDIEFSDVGGNQTTISNKCVLGEVLFNTDLNDITPTTFGYLQGVSSSIQTQIDSKTQIPTGTIIMSVGDSLQNSKPLIWLKCNGQAVSRTTYVDLYQYILSRYGSGDGSTTFNVPNFQACFLRGGMYFPDTERVVNGTTYTPNGPLTIQQDSLEAHVHSSGLSGNYLRSGSTSNTSDAYLLGASRPNRSDFPEFGGGVSTSHRTSTETRPLNYSIYYYIKT
jgi:microcystin-dependent protein